MSPNDTKALRICQKAVGQEQLREPTDALVARLIERFNLTVEWGREGITKNSVEGWLIKRDGDVVYVLSGVSKENHHFKLLAVVKASADLIQPGWYGPTRKIGVRGSLDD